MPRSTFLIAAIVTLASLSACVSEEELQRQAAIQKEVQTKIEAAYFPKMPLVMKYCVDALERGAGNEADLVQAGFRRNESIFGAVTYVAEWDTSPYLASIILNHANDSCVFKYTGWGLDLKSHRAEMGKALSEMGFRLTAISPRPPDEGSLGSGLVSGLGISSFDVQYAQRGGTIVSISGTSNPSSRQGGYRQEMMTRVDKALLPFE